MEVLRNIFLYNFHWAALGLFSALGYGVWEVANKIKKGEPVKRGDIIYLCCFTAVGFVWALIVGFYFSWWA